VNYALIALMAGTGVVITSAASCTSYLYRYRLHAFESRLPVLSAAIIAVTVVITSLQFIFPEVLSLFRRSGDGLRAGEWWRIVTPLFVQPSGWSQCLFNGAFAIGFMPVAEKVYGRGLLALYFVPGVLCQAINHVWTPDGGGSSPGLFAVMGGLLVYVVRNREVLPLQYLVLAIAGIAAGGVLSLARDGHGPALLLGALVATLIPFRRLPVLEQAPLARLADHPAPI
jgi:rhomboid protease GluP